IGEGGRGAVELAEQFGADLFAVFGQLHRPDPPVGGVGAPFDKAALFQAVDDPRHCGRVASPPVREGTHWLRLATHEPQERFEVAGSNLELGRGDEVALVLGPAEVVQRPPDLRRKAAIITTASRHDEDTTPLTVPRGTSTLTYTIILSIKISSLA